MDKRKGEGKINKRILSVMLAAVIAFPLLSVATSEDMSKVQAAATLSNPRTDSNGVVTWDRVYFGRYPQSDATGVKKDPIKWRVLSVNGDDVFLVADCNLDAAQYHDAWKEITWETCTIRSWLNGYGSNSNASKMDYSKDNFIDRAFTASEKNAILTTTVANPGNSYYGTGGGNDTMDKLFLLSYEEATNPAYGFSALDADDPAKERVNTAYVAAGGTYYSQYTNPEGQNGWWWLRSPGRYLNNAMYVGAKGHAYRDGGYVDTGKYAVCPALHLNISVSNLWSYAGTVSSNGNSTEGEAPPSVNDAEVPVADPDSNATYVETETESQNKTVEYCAPETESSTVVVPDKVTISGVTYTVTSVADNAFKNNKKIKKIIIGSNVKSIGKNAFMGCSNLQTVTIGKNVTAIGEKAFYKCTKLKKITIPSKVNKIGKQAFYGCKNLKTVTVKTTKLTSKNVGSKAFKGIYAKAAFKVPKKKLKAYKTLLKAKGANSKSKFKY